MGRGKPGYYVQTAGGQLGRTYHSDPPVNGKMVVHLQDENYKPILDEKGQHKKLLCNRDTLKLLGYID